MHQLSHIRHAEEYADSVELCHDLQMSSITQVLLRQAMWLEGGGPGSLMDASYLPGLDGCPKRVKGGREVLLDS